MTESDTRPRVPPGRRLVGVAIVVSAIVPWLFRSNVAALVADQEPVLIGYYSVERFTAAVILSVVLVWIGLVVALQASFTRRHTFRFIAVVVPSFLVILVVDVAWRVVRPVRYHEVEVTERADWPRTESGGVIRNRPPNMRYEVAYIDEPELARSYPSRPPGYPAQTLTLTTDSRGFRNPSALDACTILTIGDSFTEGSRVSDSDRWVARIEQELGVPVYNLGVSGTSIETYRNTLRANGLGLNPSVLIVMVYEGNDLRAGTDLVWDSPGDSVASVLPADGQLASEVVEEEKRSFSDVVKESPILHALERAVIRTLGSIGSDWDFAGSEMFSWMPVALQTEKGISHYAFDAERLAGLCWPENGLARTEGWQEAAAHLSQIHALCEEHDIELVLANAPAKPHVVLPLVRDTLPAEHVRSFVALEEDDLPAPDRFLAEMFDRLDVRDRLLQRLCDELDIVFISVTESLRTAMADGTQVYYTYDQHWTDKGHSVVAEVIVDRLRAMPELASVLDRGTVEGDS